MSQQPKLGGLTPFSSVDYPGQLAAVLFIAGCPWRCGYCHNPHLQNRAALDPALDWPRFIAWLHGRRQLLDAVVISGGEPLAEPQLPAMLAELKTLGFKTGLHSGGAYPQRFAACLPHLDWVGFDVKTDWADYPSITAVANSGETASDSFRQLLASKVAFECRTTLHPAYHDEGGLIALAEHLAACGVEHYAWQTYRQQGCLPSLPPLPAGWPSVAAVAQVARLFRSFSYRHD